MTEFMIRSKLPFLVLRNQTLPLPEWRVTEVQVGLHGLAAQRRAWPYDGTQIWTILACQWEILWGLLLNKESDFHVNVTVAVFIWLNDSIYCELCANIFVSPWWLISFWNHISTFCHSFSIWSMICVCLLECIVVELFSTVEYVLSG